MPVAVDKRLRERAKRLEQDVAAILPNARRVTEPWFLFNERPDVIAPLPNGKRLIVDCKSYTRHLISTQMNKVQKVYCQTSNDIAAVVVRAPGRQATITVPPSFLVELLERARGR